MLITKLDTRDFRKKDLSKYTDIIVPNSWGTSLTKSDALKIKNWIKQGGTLIGYKNIGKWFDKHEILKIDFKTKKNTARSISFDQKRDFFGAHTYERLDKPAGEFFNTEDWPELIS